MLVQHNVRAGVQGSGAVGVGKCICTRVAPSQARLCRWNRRGWPLAVWSSVCNFVSCRFVVCSWSASLPTPLHTASRGSRGLYCECCGKRMCTSRHDGGEVPSAPAIPKGMSSLPISAIRARCSCSVRISSNLWTAEVSSSVAGCWARQDTLALGVPDAWWGDGDIPRQEVTAKRIV